MADIEQSKPEFVKRDSIIADGKYVEWLGELKQRYQRSQIKAAVQVNHSMLEFYWSLGRDIVALKAESQWGSGFFNQLSLDLKKIFPGESGFSVTNLKYMKRWYLFYFEQVTNRQQLIDEFAVSNRHRHSDELEMPDFMSLPQMSYSKLTMTNRLSVCSFAVKRIRPLLNGLSAVSIVRWAWLPIKSSRSSNVLSSKTN